VIEWLFASLLALLGGGFVLHLRMRQIFRRSPALRELRRYTLSTNGVSYESQLIHCDMQWPTLSAIREGRGAFVLYFSAYVAGLVLPKRSFSSSEQVQEFKQLVRTSFKGKVQFRE
jgi:hypothetical protein